MFFATRDGIYKKFYRLYTSPNFGGSYNQVIDFLNSYKDRFDKVGLNPWELIFYSALNKHTDPEQFKTIIRETSRFIKENSLEYSLNDNVEHLGFECQLLFSFFHWGHNLNIDLDMIKTLEEEGFLFSPEFYNDVINILDGSFTYSPDTGKKWDLETFYKILKERFPSGLQLTQKSISILKENNLIQDDYPKKSLKWQNFGGEWRSEYKGKLIKMSKENNTVFLVEWNSRYTTRCNSLAAAIDIIDSVKKTGRECQRM